MIINTRNLSINDYEQLKDVMINSYNNIGGQYWRKERIEKLIQIFPEGQFCVELDGRVVACALSLIVNYADFGEHHTYEQVTGNYTFDTHDPAGDTLYGIEVVVHPDFRGMHLGRQLYEARKGCCEQFSLQSIIVGGRIPFYHLYADQMAPRAYIEKVRHNEIYDPTLSFQLANDFHVKRVLKNYLKGDSDSKEYATLLEWNNVLYIPGKKNLFHLNTCLVMKAPIINRILVPVALDNLSLEIVNLVIIMSQRHKAEIRLLHVINPEQYPFAPIGSGSLAVSVPREEAIETDTARLQQWATDNLKDRPVSYSVECRTGGLAARIVDAATDFGADLIVMGKPGTSGLLQYVIGSEAYYVIKHAPCPVMTVPEHANVSDFQRILFPLRPVPGVETKYDFTRTIVRQNNAHLTVLGLVNQHDSTEANTLDTDLAVLKKWLREDAIEADLLLSETDSTVNTVLEQARDQKADLIVITADRTTNIRHLFAGAFFKQIISQATIPVLSIKPQVAVAEESQPVSEALIPLFPIVGY